MLDLLRQRIFGVACGYEDGNHRRRLKERAQRIRIDLDPTDDPTHGQQEFTFFNGHYDTWCYLRWWARSPFHDGAEQYLVAIVLRPRNSRAKQGA